MSAAMDSHPGKAPPQPISRTFGPAIPKVKRVNLALQRDFKIYFLNSARRFLDH